MPLSPLSPRSSDTRRRPARATRRTLSDAREPTPTPFSSAARAIIVLALVAIALYHMGSRDPIADSNLIRITAVAGLVAYLILLYRNARRTAPTTKKTRQLLRVTSPEQAIAILAIALAWLWPALTIACILLGLIHTLRLYLQLVQAKIPPGLVFIGSFLALIVVGTGLLLLPAATPESQPISTVDAAFTITSAISQTGLVVRPTGEGFTRFGQTIILIWIQVGALGVIVFGALLAEVLGSSFGLKATKTIAEGTEQGWAGQLSLQRLVMFIIVVTHALEAIGAVILYFSWPETWPGMPADMETNADRAFHALFFSVSAFCNAGFVTTSDSLQSLRHHWTPHLVIVPLILIGSIGFPVLDNIARVAWAKIRGQRTENNKLIRLNLNTKLILATAFICYAVGAILIFIGEIFQAGVPVPTAALDAHFMSINRTSGFDTIPPAEMGLLSILTLILFMFIGGAPASVAGGIKLMVLAVLSLTVWNMLQGKSETTAFGRSLPDILVRKCAVIAVLVVIGIMATTGIMAATETTSTQTNITDSATTQPQTNFTVAELLFEATSAFSTCGLSLGITSHLANPSKIALIAAMFVGRVGVFAVLATLLTITRKERALVEYPTEEVVVY